MAADHVEFDPDLAAIGMIEPVFSKEFVGYATRRIVLDDELVAGYWSIDDPPVPVLVRWHEEPLDEPIPQYRTVLRWKETSW